MSTAFKPLEIGPGVAAKPTKKMRSSAWAEVNMMRWREQQLTPMGGQAKNTDAVNVTIAAASAFTTSSTAVGMATNPGTIRPGMAVTDMQGVATGSPGTPIGTVKSFGPGGGSITASAAFTTAYRGINMPPNPGWVTAGMSVTDVTNTFSLGTVASYAPVNMTLSASSSWTAGATSFTQTNAATFGIIPGLSVFDSYTSQSLGIVASISGLNTVVMTAPIPFSAVSSGDTLIYSSGTNHVLTLTALVAHASTGANDVLSFSGGAPWILTLTAPALAASVGSTDLLQFTGEGYSFLSRCKLIHGWYDVPGAYHTAYLCEQHLYVDTGGHLIDVTPVDGIIAAIGLVGGFGDALYMNPPPPDDLYGTPRPVVSDVAITRVPDAYSLDNFGSILYAMTSADGRLLKWDPAVGGPAVVQAADSGRGPVPKGRCFVVTQERFILIFGSYADGTVGGGSPRRFAWCDQENPGAWDYTNVVSQAGFLDIEPASPIICAQASRTGVLFWTAKKTYASRFLGLPYIYNYSELCDGTTPWSPQSVATTSALTLWMSEQGVFSYDGTSVLPVACLLRPWIDDNIDPVNVRELSFAAHLGEFNEWWWFFPTLNSPFNTRAVVYNYKEGWWTQVRMSRSAGMTSSYTAHPLFADDTVAFQHEIYRGGAYANASMPVVLPFAETFDLNLGPQLMTVKQLMPDIEAVGDDPVSIANAIGNLNYSLFYRNSRSLGAPELQSSPRPVRSDGYVDFRTTGRDVRLRIDVGPTIQPFTIGAHLIDVVPRGDR